MRKKGFCKNAAKNSISSRQAAVAKRCVKHDCELDVPDRGERCFRGIEALVFSNCMAKRLCGTPRAAGASCQSPEEEPREKDVQLDLWCWSGSHEPVIDLPLIIRKFRNRLCSKLDEIHGLIYSCSLAGSLSPVGPPNVNKKGVFVVKCVVVLSLSLHLYIYSSMIKKSKRNSSRISPFMNDLQRTNIPYRASPTDESSWV